MTQTQLHAGRRPGIRGVRPLTAVLAAACCVSACGGRAASSASAAPTAPAASSASAAPVASSTQASPGTQAGQDGATAAAGRGTPGAALASWIHQVAAGNRSASCRDMAAPGPSSSMATCMSAKGTASFDALHSNFVIDGIKPSTPISVAAARVTGTKATISGSDVRVSGTAMDTLMAEHSTGIKPGQLTLSFDLSRVDGAWYVTGMNMNAS
jgi:hypothetical protein